MIFSYSTLQELIDTICRLSKTDRKEITSTRLLNQPKNLKIFDYENITDFAMFDYLLKLVLGHVIIVVDKKYGAHFI